MNLQSNHLLLLKGETYETTGWAAKNAWHNIGSCLHPVWRAKRFSLFLNRCELPTKRGPGGQCKKNPVHKLQSHVSLSREECTPNKSVLLHQSNNGQLCTVPWIIATIILLFIDINFFYFPHFCCLSPYFKIELGPLNIWTSSVFWKASIKVVHFQRELLAPLLLSQ